MSAVFDFAARTETREMLDNLARSYDKLAGLNLRQTLLEEIKQRLWLPQISIVRRKGETGSASVTASEVHKKIAADLQPLFDDRMFERIATIKQDIGSKVSGEPACTKVLTDILQESLINMSAGNHVRTELRNAGYELCMLANQSSDKTIKVSYQEEVILSCVVDGLVLYRDHNGKESSIFSLLPLEAKKATVSDMTQKRCEAATQGLVENIALLQSKVVCSSLLPDTVRIATHQVLIFLYMPDEVIVELFRPDMLGDGKFNREFHRLLARLIYSKSTATRDPDLLLKELFHKHNHRMELIEISSRTVRLPSEKKALAKVWIEQAATAAKANNRDKQSGLRKEWTLRLKITKECCNLWELGIRGQTAKTILIDMALQKLDLLETQEKLILGLLETKEKFTEDGLSNPLDKHGAKDIVALFGKLLEIYLSTIRPS